MITGLRTREPLGFTKFIEMIQQAAAKKGSVFFLDCKEGHEAGEERADCERLQRLACACGRSGGVQCGIYGFQRVRLLG